MQRRAVFDAGVPYRTSARPRRTARLRLAVLLVVLAACAAALTDRFSTAASPIDLPRAQDRASHGEPRTPRAAPPGSLGEDHGALPDGVTVFDDRFPGVANLDPDLLAALHRAATDSGFAFVVDSGWRSAEYQEQLFRDAVARYGSRQEAARWVATPDASAHVSGDAVDLGPAAATEWLARHGAAYGLCQIYSNEPWHYELRPDARDNGCPAMYADATQR